MKTASWSMRRVAGQVDRSECAVRNCWEQWTREGTHAWKTGSRATRKTTRREDRRIVRQAHVDPTVARSTIQADVGVAIVPQTISRRLAEANIKSKCPFRALPLTPEHRQLRLQWCQARSMCNVRDWQKVVFSDESRFVLGTDDNLVQQDNSRPHTARVAEVFLRHVQTLPRPARSSDLSPAEHVWDQLKRQMPSCHSVYDLELVVQDLWSHLPQDNIRCLINSTPDRLAACFAAGGDPTRYCSCSVFVSLHTLYSFNCLAFEIK
ncbi:transposable element Tcb2 transposase [Trichonephila clavipes]|nr:transposable element Tcb2 transposase [Trichonephila clavipes]